MTETLRLVTCAEADTRALGRILADALGAGDVVFLIGELGAGKTQFAKGVADGLGINGDGEVTSPTFTIVNEHRGRLRLYHVDLYRIEDAGELAGIGIDEILDGSGISVVEWADRFAGALGRPTATVRLTVGAAETERLVEIEWSEGTTPAALEEATGRWRRPA